MLCEYIVQSTDPDTAYTFCKYRYDDRPDKTWGEEQDLENRTVQLPNEVDHLELLVVRHCYYRNHKLLVSAAAIQSMKKLTVLKLVSCNIVGEVSRLFKDMSVLSVLKIRTSTIESEGLLSAISALTSLQNLVLDCVDIPKNGDDRLTIEHMSELRRVYIDAVNMKHLPVPPPSIEEYFLEQYESNLRIEGTIDSIDWSRYTVLWSLSIIDTDITGTVPDSLINLESLSELDLSHNNKMQSTQGLEQKLSHLRYLSLLRFID